MSYAGGKKPAHHLSAIGGTLVSLLGGRNPAHLISTTPATSVQRNPGAWHIPYIMGQASIMGSTQELAISLSGGTQGKGTLTKGNNWHKSP